MENETVTTETRIDRVKNFAVRHKTKLAVAGTATLCLAINRIALKQHEDFIESKGLMDEFRAVGQFEEL